MASLCRITGFVQLWPAFFQEHSRRLKVSFALGVSVFLLIVWSSSSSPSELSSPSPSAASSLPHLLKLKHSQKHLQHGQTDDAVKVTPATSLASKLASATIVGSLASLSASTPALADATQPLAPATTNAIAIESQQFTLKSSGPQLLDAPDLKAGNILDETRTEPPLRTPMFVWIRCAILMAMGPAMMSLIYFRRDKSSDGFALEMVGTGASFGHSFDPLNLAKESVLEMSGGETGNAADNGGKSQEKSKLLHGGAPTGSGGSGGDQTPKLYTQRWIQLAYLSLFAMISDWVCFSVAAAPDSWYRAYGHEPAELVDLFLFTNVFSCFMFTDVARYYGLRKVIIGSATLMTAGCFLRSGIPFVGGLPSYTLISLGTVFVGAAQPFFQCTPPLLSATWFGPKERALATATAINFNQVGIAAAFLFGGLLAQTPEGLPLYFSIISVVTLVVTLGSYFQFKDRPLTPPSASAAIREAAEDAVADKKKFEFLFPSTAWSLLKQPGFRTPLAGFVASIGITNIISTFTDSSLRRAGFLETLNIDLSGAAFQLAIVLGGIFVGSYVDRTKKFKSVTMLCFYISGILLTILSVAFGNDITPPEWLVLLALLGVGATLGPVQPINAELAVEATYPADENAIEAVQQLCGNLFSALLVPLCGLAAAYDLDWFGKVDVRGDSICILLLILVTTLYYSTFNSPLKRAELDSAMPPAEATDGIEA